jgi:hypothetical protein
MRKTGSKTKWQRVDLNRRPRAYESPALPLSYAASKQKYNTNSIRLSMSLDEMDSFSGYCFRFWGGICKQF